MIVEGLLLATVWDEAGPPIAQVGVLLRGQPDPDGETVDVARPATPEQGEMVVLPGLAVTPCSLVATRSPLGSRWEGIIPRVFSKRSCFWRVFSKRLCFWASKSPSAPS